MIEIETFKCLHHFENPDYMFFHNFDFKYYFLNEARK